MARDPLSLAWELRLQQPWRQKYRANNPRPGGYDPAAESAKATTAVNSYDDWLRSNGRDILRAAGVPDFTIQNLMTAAEFVPGVGDALDVQDAGNSIAEAWRNPTWGNLGGAGLMGAAALASIVPVGGDAAKSVLKHAAKDVAGEGVERMARNTASDALRAADPKPGIRAYHGSPHDFDKFDISKIGAGEGAQAYGHGLYFAEAEDVARSYRDGLTNGQWEKATFDGTPVFDLPDPVREKLYYHFGGYSTTDDALLSQRDSVARYLDEAGGDVTDPIYQDELKSLLFVEDAAKRLQFPKGHMYEVNINADPADFLDWDKPLSEQPAKVRDRLLTDPAINDAIAKKKAEISELVKTSPDYASNVGPSPKATGNKLEDLIAEAFDYRPKDPETYQKILEAEAELKRLERSQPDGRAVIWGDTPVGYTIGQRNAHLAGDMLGQNYATPQDFASELRKAGIPGIKYLDQGSRAAGEGSRNYVVFDDALVEILRKYGIGALLAGTGAASLIPILESGGEPYGGI